MHKNITEVSIADFRHDEISYRYLSGNYSAAVEAILLRHGIIKAPKASVESIL